MKILSFLVLTLTLLSVNAYAFQVADSQYSGGYNGLDLTAAQTAFNGIRSRGAGGGVPVGTIVAVPSHTVAKFLEQEPEAWLPCNGYTTHGTELATLMSFTPNLNGKFLEGSDGSSQEIPAGLPNIKGEYTQSSLYYGYDDGLYTGAFQKKANHNVYALSNTTGACTYMSGWIFDASRVSSVYRNDISTVQPEAYTVRYYIRCNE